MTTQLITSAPRAHPVYLVDPATETDIGVGGAHLGASDGQRFNRVCCGDAGHVGLAVGPIRAL